MQLVRIGSVYRDVVEPLVRPWRHAAGLLGWGSDVLGYDTERSTDHGWGLRLQIFVGPGDAAAARRAVDTGLPAGCHGWPVRYGWDDQPVRHRVDITTLADWLPGQLGIDPRDGLTTLDWLSLPQQVLLGVVAGAVYADPDGELARIRRSLAWYPHDVWLWLLACGWQRLARKESFVGRAAEVGDDLGSRLLAGRLVRDVMRQAFLLERTYAPYPKWFGTAFARLRCALDLTPALSRALSANSQSRREAALVDAYERLARLHNAAALTATVDPTARTFHERPFRVLGADRFVDACLAVVRDPMLRALPLVGSADQLADSTDLLSQAKRAGRLRTLYETLSRADPQSGRTRRPGAVTAR